MDNRTVSSTRLSRRAFLKGTAAGALAAPYVAPASALGATSPSNRINVALIGAGNQSRVDLPGVMRYDDVQVLAICDVNRGSHGYARAEHFLGREPVRDRVHGYYAKKAKSGTYKGVVRSIATFATCWLAKTSTP